MKFSITIILFFLLLLTPVAAQERQLLNFGAEWVAGNVSRCMPPGGGVACYKFPNGALLYGYDWQSSVKVDGLEVLFNLIMSPDPTTWVGGTIIVPCHHPVSEKRCHRAFSFNGHVRIPPGWYVWIAIATNGTTNHSAPLEVQTQIFIEPTLVEVP